MVENCFLEKKKSNTRNGALSKKMQQHYLLRKKLQTLTTEVGLKVNLVAFDRTCRKLGQEGLSQTAHTFISSS